MLRAAQSDAFRPELDGKQSVFGRVRIGANAESANLIRPAQKRAELDGKYRVLDGNSTDNDFAERAIEGNLIALRNDRPADSELFLSASPYR